MGAVVQFRLLGGAVGLSIATSVVNSYLRSHLSGLVSLDQLESILRSVSAIDSLDPSLGSTVRAVFGRAYNLQMKLMIGFGAAQIPASLLLWGKHINVGE